MSSSLCVVARSDIHIEAGLEAARIRGGDDAFFTLWALLQDTNVDAASAAPHHLWEFADNSCVYMAIIRKRCDVEALIPRERAVQLTPDTAAWGVVSPLWKAPSSAAQQTFRLETHSLTLGGDRDTGDSASAPLSRLAERLSRRYAPHQEDYMGRLLKYGFMTVLDEHRYRRRHVFLFETALLLLSGPARPINADSDANYEFVLERNVPLVDIHNAGLDMPRQQLTITMNHGVDIVQESQQRLFLLLDDTFDLRAWSKALNDRLLVVQAALRNFRDEARAHALADLRAALRGGLPLERLGKFGPAVIGNEEGVEATCGVYLLGNALIFLVDDGGALLVHRLFHLSTVLRIERPLYADNRTVALGVVEVHDCAALKETAYSFRVADTTQAWDWFRVINETVRSVPSVVTQMLDRDTISTDSPAWLTAGIVFLAPAASGENEYNIGVATLPTFASDGLATHIMAHALGVAFDNLGAHRVQARVLHRSQSDAKDDPTPRAISKLVHWGFSHEGTQRHAFMHPGYNCWVDTTLFSVLDSDWIVRDSVKPAPQSLWDEMFARHQRERDELLHREGVLKRTKSIETVQDLRSLEDSAPSRGMAGETRESSAVSSSSGISSIKPGSGGSPPRSEDDGASNWATFSATSSESAPVPTRVKQSLTGADDAADEFSSEWEEMGEDTDDQSDEAESM